MLTGDQARALFIAGAATIDGSVLARAVHACITGADIGIITFVVRGAASGQGSAHTDVVDASILGAVISVDAVVILAATPWDELLNAHVV